MKSIIFNNNAASNIFKNGRLVITKNGMQQVVFLTETSPLGDPYFTGVEVHNPDGCKGYITTSWLKDAFEDFTGELTLSNNS